MATPATVPAQLTEGPIGPILWRLTLPMVLGVFFLMAVNFMDTYFVGKLGVAPLAAMSFTFPVISIILGLTMGLGVGATSAISRAIGHGDSEQVQRLTTHALMLAVFVVLVICGLGLIFQHQIFLSLGAKPSLLPLIEEYMTIWFVGVVFLVIPMVGNGAIRATGDAKSPMLMMMAAAIINGVLDPILIFGVGSIPPMGLKGAAIATLIARAVTCLIGLYILGVRLKLLNFHLPKWSELWTSWKALLSVGLPAALTNLLAPMATTAVTTLIAAHGNAAVAGYGLAGRIESLFLIVPMVLGGALSPFIGQNWGGHFPSRVQEGIRKAMKVAVIWGLGAWLVVEIFAPSMAPLLSKDAKVQEVLILYLRILSAGYIVHGLVSIVSASFNAMDHAIRSTVISATQGLFLAVPFAIVGNMFFSLGGIFGGLLLAKVLTALISTKWLKALFRSDEMALSPMSKDAEKAFLKVKGAQPQLVSSFTMFIEQLQHLETLEIGTSRRDTLSFRVKGRELAHLHPHGFMDIPFPPSVRDELLKLKKVEYHRHHHDSCWVSHKVATSEDLDEALWLIQLSYLLHLAARKGSDSPEAKALGQRLHLPDELQVHLNKCSGRYTTQQ